MISLRGLGRLFRKGSSGIDRASAGTAASKLSRTPRRAKQRLRRKPSKAERAKLALANPAGSKILRRYAKAKQGVRHTYAEAVAFHAGVTG